MRADHLGFESTITFDQSEYLSVSGYVQTEYIQNTLFKKQSVVKESNLNKLSLKTNVSLSPHQANVGLYCICTVCKNELTQICSTSIDTIYHPQFTFYSFSHHLFVISCFRLRPTVLLFICIDVNIVHPNLPQETFNILSNQVRRKIQKLR